ncbi:MAG: trypsin-like peptidase domain-containing protein [Pirellulaceae bacterium]
MLTKAMGALALAGLLGMAMPHSAGADELIQDCAVQLKLNSHKAGYSGTGTGTLVHHKGGYYLVTALHNLKRAKTKLTIALPVNLFFSDSDLDKQFVSVEGSDLAVAKFLPDRLTDKYMPRFRELISANGKVRDPLQGQSLAAVGNPVFVYESSSRLQKSIVYQGVVAEYAEPGILVGNVAHITDEMIILESLSVMPGFSGGPLLLASDRTAPAQVAGIVVGGDPRSIVSPGRFVFAVPATKVESAIEELEKRLQDSSYVLKEGMVALDTNLDSVRRDDSVGLRYSGENIVVIDVDGQNSRQNITNEFLAERAEEVENADMVFHRGIFGDVKLELLQPSRATFIKCQFQNQDALSRANLMGARFVDCEFLLPDGTISAEPSFSPKLAYGITTIAGIEKTAPATAPPAPALDSILVELGATAQLAREEEGVSKPIPASSPTRNQSVSIRANQFHNVLTRDLFGDEP